MLRLQGWPLRATGPAATFARLWGAGLGTRSRIALSPPGTVRTALLCRQAGGSSAGGLRGIGTPTVRELESVIQGRQGGKKPRRNVAGVISINCQWNNTLCNISDSSFVTKAKVTAGSCGFKKSKRSSVFAMEKTVAEAFAKARTLGIRKVMVNLTGSALVLRKPMIQALREQSNLRIMKLRLSTSVPHGGCRPRKARRRRIRTRSRR